ncbi:hypothetical protein [Agrilutibacter solisilvae]|uniref:Uncharacterized protein n=1 Tax=Agrilutibacter solisilvae TaxID=2763317 RepID=A0A975ASW2_9GAMM|nr:hypothetical protein [Lysobacter solisilvae]QSX79384.1 hypothetical protein I8J32_005850 [Lysobacter solisilvae]
MKPNLCPINALSILDANFQRIKLAHDASKVAKPVDKLRNTQESKDSRGRIAYVHALGAIQQVDDPKHNYPSSGSDQGSEQQRSTSGPSRDAPNCGQVFQLDDVAVIHSGLTPEIGPRHEAASA